MPSDDSIDLNAIINAMADEYQQLNHVTIQRDAREAVYLAPSAYKCHYRHHSNQQKRTLVL